VTEYEGEPSADYDCTGMSIGTDRSAPPPSAAEVIMFVATADVIGIGIETIDGIKIGGSEVPLEAANSSDGWQPSTVHSFGLNGRVRACPHAYLCLFRVEARTSN